MDRDEVLKKAQAENKDERELQVKDKSMMWSYLVMVVLAAVFTAVRAGQGLPMMDLSATVCGSVCAGMIYRYIKTRERFFLVLAAVTFIVAVVAAIRFFMGH